MVIALMLCECNPLEKSCLDTHITQVGWAAGIVLIVMMGIQFWFLPLALSLAVNLWSTVAIGFKTW